MCRMFLAFFKVLPLKTHPKCFHMCGLFPLRLYQNMGKGGNPCPSREEEAALAQPKAQPLHSTASPQGEAKQKIWSKVSQPPAPSWGTKPSTSPTPRCHLGSSFLSTSKGGMTRPRKKKSRRQTHGFQRSQVNFHDAQELLPAPSCKKPAFHTPKLPTQWVPHTGDSWKPAAVAGQSRLGWAVSPGEQKSIAWGFPPAPGNARPSGSGPTAGDNSEHAYSPGGVGAGVQ